ncbi:hypothetical protein D9615_005208 [Tricholomella constricta]|uniref:Uncharacterized protein n=1 Tax=Tricholomella constricta TaxID=117010 RepID=A0A8H5H637_9AGAR|nr:hypothetical protein D9615_005208 [Tricholomella constricta]
MGRRRKPGWGNGKMSTAFCNKVYMRRRHNVTANRRIRKTPSCFLSPPPPRNLAHMDSHSHLKGDFDTPPPQYPAANQPHHFHIPSFNDVMALYEYEDSIRLPTYQARTIRRYHPYWRIRPATPFERDNSARYFNTIFDESMVELDVPAAAPRRVPTPYQAAAAAQGHETTGRLEALIPPAPLGPPPLPPAPAGALAHVAAQGRGAEDETVDMDEQHRRRVHRLWYLIPEFVVAVMQALEAASRAVELPLALAPAPVAEDLDPLPTPPPTPPPPPPTTDQSDR